MCKRFNDSVFKNANLFVCVNCNCTGKSSKSKPQMSAKLLFISEEGRNLYISLHGCQMSDYFSRMNRPLLSDNETLINQLFDDSTSVIIYDSRFNCIGFK